ncbi:hypothetical protein [Gilliamella sp. Fer4-1]|jgi:hypothetical protein|uniref:tail fiber/spike domain-containing protein n=1 Tax=Gilliamella sp. Fer4-1 TaxID=3120242 RepID=UPI00080E2535|nr:hypothetical protein [Gilliamella apicola]OCG67044.1 hypothetical protein A9G30_05970 [Gilliamella apicola]
MEHLIEEVKWEDNVYLIQRKDRVGGGVRGIANKPHYELANRTQYLKRTVDTINTALEFTLSASEDNSNFDAKCNRIENLKKPENKNDAVNKEYVDGNDEKLQKQVNELIEAKIGYESIGNFNDGCTINTRNEIVYDEQTKKYYAWAGNLPHHVLPETNVTDEMNNGKPWLVIENSNEFIAKIESIKQIAQSVATQFYGFKKDGAKLILETAGNIDNNILNIENFLEWVIAPGGCEFTVNNKNLLMVI